MREIGKYCVAPSMPPRSQRSDRRTAAGTAPGSMSRKAPRRARRARRRTCRPSSTARPCCRSTRRCQSTQGPQRAAAGRRTRAMRRWGDTWWFVRKARLTAIAPAGTRTAAAVKLASAEKHIGRLSSTTVSVVAGSIVLSCAPSGSPAPRPRLPPYPVAWMEHDLVAR